MSISGEGIPMLTPTPSIIDENLLYTEHITENIKNHKPKKSFLRDVRSSKRRNS